MHEHNPVNINKELVRRHFNRHAHEYDRYAAIQAEMGGMLVSRLQRLRLDFNSAIRILEIGSGTGSLTRLMLDHFPYAQYTAVDISDSMIDMAREKLGFDARRVRFILGDAEEVILHPPYDVIVSNATFQWFNRPEQTAQIYLNRLAPEGVIAFTTFGPLTFHELHSSFREAEKQLGLEHLPHGQSFLGGEEWQDIFKNGSAGTMNWEWEETIKEVVYPNVIEFLHSINKAGAGNASTSKAANYTVSRRLFSAMERHYAEHYSTPLGVKAAYHLGLGVCRKD